LLEELDACFVHALFWFWYVANWRAHFNLSPLQFYYNIASTLEEGQEKRGRLKCRSRTRHRG
jgi:hypothetical protein